MRNLTKEKKELKKKRSRNLNCMIVIRVPLRFR